MTAGIPYGRRLMLDIIEERASNGHARPYASIPRSDDPKDGFTDVSFAMLRDAVDRVAHWLDDSLGKATNFETFGWMAPATDLRYLLLVLAIMKTGHRAFFPSPRNSDEAHLSLLEATDCGIFIEPADAPVPAVAELLQKRDMRHFQMPALDRFLADSARQPYPFDKSFDQVRWDPCLVLHTSGSTGLPKPIELTHGWFSVIDAYHAMPDLGAGTHGIKALEGLKLFTPFPNFHSAAITFKLCNAIFWDIQILNPPNQPLTAELADACHVHGEPQASMLPASVLRDLTQNQEALKNVERLRYLAFSGSALGDDVGEIVQRRTHLLNFYGTTETALAPFEKVGPEDWGYLKFTAAAGYDFRPASDEDEYEMVMVKRPELELMQGAFLVDRETHEWQTNDLWTRHPDKPDLWHYEGRLDDIVIFENGEKLNPTTMQHQIEESPLVSGAIVAGAGRFQPCLLLEPQDVIESSADRSAFIDKVWPAVEAANEEAVAHGRISRDLVLVSLPDKQWVRTDKGSVKKKLVLALYEEDIDNLYQSLESRSASSPDSPDLDLSTPESAKHALRALIEKQTPLKDLKDDQDFFSSGMDSLQASELSRSINNSTQFNQKLELRDIYSHSSLGALAALLSNSSDSDSAPKSSQEPSKSREEQMDDLLHSLSADFPLNARAPKRLAADTPFTVLLTGTTGSLGAYLLDRLLLDPRVAQVICLNRSASAADRQHESHTTRNLTTDFTKATFITAPDFSQPYLSVPRDTYAALLHSTTHVIHNAWPVDFNRSLASLASHVRGTRRLIDFCSASRHAAHLTFISTIAASGAHPSPSAVPEAINTDWHTSQKEGYGSSKHIAEVLVHAAAQAGCHPATIIKLGQVAGPVEHGAHGAWAPQEWLPSLLASSVRLGKLPDGLGAADSIDWMPVDVLARAVAQLVVDAPAASPCCSTAASASDGARVRHIVNPQTTTWKTLVPAVLDALPAGKKPDVIPLGEWIAALRSCAEKGDKVEENPGLKLLPFYEGLAAEGARMPRLDTKMAARESEALRGLGAVGAEWMALWMEQWRFA